MCWPLYLTRRLYVWCSCTWWPCLNRTTWFLCTEREREREIQITAPFHIHAYRLFLFLHLCISLSFKHSSVRPNSVLLSEFRLTMWITWYASIFAKLANTGSVANANVSEHSSTGWIICRICERKKKTKISSNQSHYLCTRIRTTIDRIESGNSKEEEKKNKRNEKEKERQFKVYLWMSESFQLLNRIS